MLKCIDTPIHYSYNLNRNRYDLTRYRIFYQIEESQELPNEEVSKVYTCIPCSAHYFERLHAGGASD